jgi:hypothetical protein
MDTPNTDLKTDFTNSYNRGGNPNFFSSFEQVPAETQVNDNVAALLKRNVRESLSNPAVDPLGEKDYYPGIERGINVGQFSGPLGSVPQYAAGMPHVPWGVIDARNVARQKAQKEYEQELLKNLSYDYLQTKDKVKQGSLIRLSDKLYGDVYKKYTDESGPIVGAMMAKNSQEFKRTTAELTQLRDKLDDNYDWSTSTLLQYMHQNVAGGSETITTKEAGSKKGEGTTTVEKDVDVAPTKGQVAGYVSGYTAGEAQNYLNKTANGDMSLEEVADLNHNFRTKMIVSQNMDQQIAMIGKSLTEDVRSQIMSEAQAGNYAIDPKTGELLIHGKLGSDKDNVNIIMTEAGLGKEKLDEIAERRYNDALESATDAYGEDLAKKNVPPLSVWKNELERYAYKQTKLEMKNSENFDPFRYYHEAWERAEKGFRELKPNKDIDKFDGKEKSIIKIPEDVGKRNIVPIQSGQSVATMTTTKNPYTNATEQKVSYEELPVGDYVPVATKEGTEVSPSGSIEQMAEVKRVQRIPLTYTEDKVVYPVLNDDGSQAYEIKDVDSKIYSVPYSLVQKTLESDPKTKITGISGGTPASTYVKQDEGKGKTKVPKPAGGTQSHKDDPFK